MQIGKYKFKNNLILAPMSGITDYAMQKICKQKGAAASVNEMLHSQQKLWHSNKSKTRMVYCDKQTNIVQILGNDPQQMAKSAQALETAGANIIDINFGCPAKKVCKKMAGSNLLADLKLVQNIITQVVNSVNIGVTIKMRTGLNAQHKTALEAAKIAYDCGVQAISIHGRTRDDKFKGTAEHKTVAEVKKQINTTIIANGDIKTTQQVQNLLTKTKVDGIMIGRGACGNPWIFKQINQELAGLIYQPPENKEVKETMLEHLFEVDNLYGNNAFRLFRKHFIWYLNEQFNDLPIADKHKIKTEFNQLKTTNQQNQFIKSGF